MKVTIALTSTARTILPEDSGLRIHVLDKFYKKRGKALYMAALALQHAGAETKGITLAAIQVAQDVTHGGWLYVRLTGAPFKTKAVQQLITGAAPYLHLVDGTKITFDSISDKDLEYTKAMILKAPSLVPVVAVLRAFSPDLEVSYEYTATGYPVTLLCKHEKGSIHLSLHKHTRRWNVQTLATSITSLFSSPNVNANSLLKTTHAAVHALQTYNP